MRKKISVKTKSVYDKEDETDGLRVLVTRYWPRGVKRERADLWIRGLGPSTELIKDWKKGALEWDEFRKRFEKEFRDEGKQKLLDELEKAVIESGEKKATLLCTCREEAVCHRIILKEMIEEGGA
ncbi:MAG: DUF488 family protein [Deltaproteobacteria bacterium]|nr:DUF488 family protein [Deltaproteobacteria bacterium]MBZ0220588.1 DUF488 family protein [Deltaproteobacteria bacterium]